MTDFRVKQFNKNKIILFLQSFQAADASSKAPAPTCTTPSSRSSRSCPRTQLSTADTSTRSRRCVSQRMCSAPAAGSRPRRSWRGPTSDVALGSPACRRRSPKRWPSIRSCGSTPIECYTSDTTPNPAWTP